MDLQLADKIALISGSTKGIGLAIATGLAREGVNVIINGRSEESVDGAFAKIRETLPDAKLGGFAGDLANATVVEKLVNNFPAVDILVNNLGIFEPKPFEQIPDADWVRFFEVNVLSGVRLSRAYLAGMKHKNWGRIIFISSESGVQIPAEMIHYGMTKTAQLAVSRGLAETCAGTGVTVNAVLPGPTRSDGVDEFVKQLSGGKPFAEGIFHQRPAQLFAQTFCHHRRSRQPRRLCLQPAVVGHEWSRPASGRRHDPFLFLKHQRTGLQLLKNFMDLAKG